MKVEIERAEERRRKKRVWRLVVLWNWEQKSKSNQSKLQIRKRANRGNSRFMRKYQLVAVQCMCNAHCAHIIVQVNSLKESNLLLCICAICKCMNISWKQPVLEKISAGGCALCSVHMQYCTRAFKKLSAI